MSDVRMVKCRKLGRELPGLSRPPYRNELGKRIYEEVSKEAWDEWIKHSVRYVNTYFGPGRLDMASKEGQDFLFKQAAVFFGFEEGDLAQTAYTPSGDEK
jgi:Fe-S cluster biosynthesis and repair protein YggX